MTTKSCGTCEFWDRENASIYGAIEKPRAECLADVPFSVRDPEKSDTTETDGEYCDTYKKIKEKMINKIMQFQYVQETERNPSFLIALREDGTLWEFYDSKWTILDSPPDTNSIPQKK